MSPKKKGPEAALTQVQGHDRQVEASCAALGHGHEVFVDAAQMGGSCGLLGMTAFAEEAPKGKASEAICD